jgi:hypothetical protein
MKLSALILILLFSLNSFSQTKEGFKKDEARDMIALCCSFTFLDFYKTDTVIIPANYKKVFTSGTIGMDNKYQIYVNSSKTAVINLRGSTENILSWMENIHSAMIPAKGKIKISEINFDYCFAKDTAAAVHAGYALAIGYLHKEILQIINTFNKKGIYKFIITGHSQGGALANLLRAYLENLSNSEISKDNIFKTYSFGAPMVGNKEFSKEYNLKFCTNNTSFNIVNPLDKVPLLPLSYNDTNYFKKNFAGLISENESINIRNAVSDGILNVFENNLSEYIKIFGESTSKQIANNLGKIEFPKYSTDINYSKLGNTIEVTPVIYPKILRNPEILKNDSLMKVYKKAPDGSFINKELYKKEPLVFQHRPYNYYNSILKGYFPEEYKLLKVKFLPENL